MSLWRAGRVFAWLGQRFKRTRSVGRRGERAAWRYLKRGGYRLIAKNVRSTLGEVDLIVEAPDGRAIVFVEVKAREVGPGSVSSDPTRPEVHVHADKQARLVALANAVSRRNGWSRRPVRFDVVGVDLARRRRPVIRHHPGAFESRL